MERDSERLFLIQGLHKMLIGNIKVRVPACSTSDAGDIRMREGLTSASARRSLRIMFWIILIFDFSCISNQAVSTARVSHPSHVSLPSFCDCPLTKPLPSCICLWPSEGP